MSDITNTIVDLVTDNKYWISRILKDAELNPEEINIVSLPNENFGSIHVLIPSKFLDIREGDETDGRTDA